MLVAIHQNAYLPWLPYIDKVARADLFILLDDVQFQKNGWMNRQLIKTAAGPAMLTVPVSLAGYRSSTIRDIPIADQRFAAKHFRTISQAYARAPNASLLDEIGELYGRGHETIAELTEDQLHFWLELLGINTLILRSSDLRHQGTGSDLVLSLCQEVGADAYLVGGLGRSYMDETSFERAGIKLVDQAFEHPVYAQPHGDFVPNLGVIDYILCADIGLL